MLCLSLSLSLSLSLYICIYIYICMCACVSLSFSLLCNYLFIQFLIFNFSLQGLTATGLKRDLIFIGDINTLYKSGNTTVDVKIDTYSNVRIKKLFAEKSCSSKCPFSYDVESCFVKICSRTL